MAVRSALAHQELVVALQEEYLADDLQPPMSSTSWTEERLRAWFEAGGEAPVPAAEDATPDDSPPAVLAEGEHEVCIPVPGGSALHGKLTWPGGSHVEIGILWCSGNPNANPHLDYWGEDMDAPLPAAIARASMTREHTNRQAVACLRFNYSSCGASRTKRGFDPSGNMWPPRGPAEAKAAFDYLHTRCTKIAFGGHNVGSSNAVEAAAAVDSDGLIAIVSVGHAPDVYKFCPAGMQADVRASMEASMRALPPGVPKLFLAASMDPVSPAASMERVIALAPAPIEWSILESTQYSLASSEGEVTRTVLRFVYEAMVRWVVGGRM